MIETDKLAAKAVSAERLISASPASPNEEAFERALRPSCSTNTSARKRCAASSISS